MKQCLWVSFFAGLVVLIGVGCFPLANAAAQETPPANITEEPVSDTPQASVAQITNVRVENQGGSVLLHVEATGALQYTAFKLTDPLRLVLDFQNMGPATLTAPIQVNQGVVGAIRALYFDEAQIQRLEIDLTSTAAYEIQKPDANQLMIRLKGSGPKIAQAPVSDQTSAATPVMLPGGDSELKEPTSSAADLCEQFLASKTQAVSLELKNASLSNIFRFLSDIQGVNVVVSPAVTGQASVKVQQVPWNQVFMLLAANHDLGLNCVGDIVRVTPLLDLKEERFAQPFITQLARLNYADPDTVMANLKELSSANGNVVSDKRTNSVIISDTERVVIDMMEVIRNLDKPTRQVHIESKLVQVDRNFSQELGIQWGFSGTALRNPQFPNAIQFSGAARGDGTLSAPVQAGGVNLGGGPSQFGDTPGSTTFLSGPRIDPGFIVDLATVAPPFGAIATTLRALSGDLTLDLQLSALERQGRAKTITSPKVTALDNKEAMIRSGTRLPFQTTDPAQGTQIQFIDAVIELRVTPHVTAEDMVLMRVAASQNVPDAARAVGGIPVILTKEAATELLVANRDTAVLGGLYTKVISDNTRAVPYVSEIPILGNLFKSTAETDNITELLIFIQPTVVKRM